MFTMFKAFRFGALGLAVATGIYTYQRDLAAQSRNMVDAPYFEVDPFWPKPLPNHWLLGSAIGVAPVFWVIALMLGAGAFYNRSGNDPTKVENEPPSNRETP